MSLDLFYYARGYDRDGYTIHPKRKKILRKFLNIYPENVFSQLNESRSLLSEAIVSVFTGGWGGEFIPIAATSIITFLLEQGAGIACNIYLPGFDLTKIKPQLFAGASGVFLEKHADELDSHVLSYKDIIRLKKKNKLSYMDCRRLDGQAERALKYGAFDSSIKKDLVMIRRVIEAYHFLETDKEFDAYAEYKLELAVIMLQVMHQVAKSGFPTEMTQLILSQLTGLEIKELTAMENKFKKLFS